ncbi:MULTISPECIES: hypothetical protein [Streptomyces]|uniref:hypothetical protein n=1 Tax=Streptomyces TaxID=1883 RepID=UPI0016880FE2|nr:hypothetical protein [Streptomyces venezuelae]
MPELAIRLVLAAERQRVQLMAAAYHRPDARLPVEAAAHPGPVRGIPRLGPRTILGSGVVAGTLTAVLLTALLGRFGPTSRHSAPPGPRARE